MGYKNILSISHYNIIFKNFFTEISELGFATILLLGTYKISKNVAKQKLQLYFARIMQCFYLSNYVSQVISEILFSCKSKIFPKLK